MRSIESNSEIIFLGCVLFRNSIYVGLWLVLGLDLGLGMGLGFFKFRVRFR